MPARRLLMRKIARFTTQARARTVPPGGGAGVRRRRGDGQSLSAEGGATWARLAVAGRFGRRGARGSIVSTRRAGARPDPARLRVHPPRAQARQRHAAVLWEEYAQIHPDGYGRTQFCEIYRQWTRRLRPSMRQVHRAGEKTFIDYSGKRPSLVDRRTGELRRVELFVAVLGASSLTYAAATETQQLPDWIDAHIRMVEYFGRRYHVVGPRPAQERHHPPLPLRARRQPHLRGPGHPLRRRRRSGATEETSG